MKIQVSFCGHVLEEDVVRVMIDRLVRERTDAVTQMDLVEKTTPCYSRVGDIHKVRTLLAERRELAKTIKVYEEKIVEFCSLLGLICYPDSLLGLMFDCNTKEGKPEVRPATARMVCGLLKSVLSQYDLLGLMETHPALASRVRVLMESVSLESVS